MSRNVIGTMNSIFDALKEYVASEDTYRIANVNRHIKPIGDAAPVCEFVKRAKAKKFIFGDLQLCIYEVAGNRYVLLPERYLSALNSIGFENEEDIAVVQGAGMMAIGVLRWPVKVGITSLELVEYCLGIEEQDITFDFADIRKLFTSYSVVKIDDSRFEMLYEEDVQRLCCYILASENNKMNFDTKNNLQNLCLLRSSRSIVLSIINGYRSPLEEYTFLQLYQCLEYLYRLNNCFILSGEHGIPLGTAIDIVTSYEFKISEEENLYHVIKNHASDVSLDTFISVCALTMDVNNDKSRVVGHYIYRLRCNIAHLRYNQDNTLDNVKWDVCITALVEIIYSIYQKIDNDIFDVCNSKGVWKNLII